MIRCNIMVAPDFLARYRFASGGEDTEDLRPFVSCLKQLGFESVSTDASNKMFVIMVFRKAAGDAPPKKSIAWPTLKACVYKKR